MTVQEIRTFLGNRRVRRTGHPGTTDNTVSCEQTFRRPFPVRSSAPGGLPSNAYFWHLEELGPRLECRLALHSCLQEHSQPHPRLSVRAVPKMAWASGRPPTSSNTLTAASASSVCEGQHQSKAASSHRTALQGRPCARAPAVPFPAPSPAMSRSWPPPEPGSEEEPPPHFANSLGLRRKSRQSPRQTRPAVTGKAFSRLQILIDCINARSTRQRLFHQSAVVVSFQCRGIEACLNGTATAPNLLTPKPSLMPT